MSYAESRSHPRYAVAIQCQISEGPTEVEGTTENLSRGGVSLMLPLRFELSSLVDLSLALVFGDNTYSEPLKLQATVVWCTRIGSKYQLGAKFANLSDEQRGYLETFIHFLEGGTDEGEDSTSV